VSPAKKRGRGRPALPKGTARMGVFAIRLSDEEREAIDVAAERSGKPITRWARDVLLAATDTA
jgi:hypothetical protein